MKILKILGIVLALIVAVILIGGMVVPKEGSFSKSVQIDAPIDVVWEHTNSLDALDSWSPWVAKDPNAKTEKTGESGTVGSTTCWDSENEKVGKGCQEITKIDAPNRLETKMEFERPDESEATSFVDLQEAEGGTTVTWGFEFTMPYPFNFFAALGDMDAQMEKAVGEDFTNGLNSLKSMAEAAATIVPVPEMEAHDEEGMHEEGEDGHDH